MRFDLAPGLWTMVAAAGATVEAQNLTTHAARITIAATPPAPDCDGETLGADDHRAFDAPLPADLYATAIFEATQLEVLPIGSVAAGGSDDAAGEPLEASGAPTSLPDGDPLSTVAPSARVGGWFCQNQSAAPLLVALDDGAGGALSILVLDPGAAAGRQGGSAGSADTGPHLGRIRVYGPAGSQHTLRVR